MKVLTKVNDFIVKHRLSALREVLIFCLITIVVHFLYRYWANVLDYKPIRSVVILFSDFLAQQVISGSSWFLSDVLNIDVRVINEKIYLPNDGWVGVGMGCSAFKQMVQFFFLMVLYPGRWIHKVWYIPAGFIVIQLVNIIRIVTLSLITHYSLSQNLWDFSHDYILRPLFYVAIFSMWVIWIEFISKRTERKGDGSS